MLTKLSGECVYYGDLQHIDKKKKEIKIIGDGACPPSLASKLGPARFADHGIPTEGDAGGLSVKLVCKAGEGVLARLGRINGDFQMVITRATIFEPSCEEIDRRLNECGIPFWPHGFVTAHCDMEALLQNWNNEYACLGYGHHLYRAGGILRIDGHQAHLALTCSLTLLRQTTFKEVRRKVQQLLNVHAAQPLRGGTAPGPSAS